MDSLFELAWKNVAIAGVLALAAAAAGRFIRRPALTHALWLLVLLKLVTPPLWHLPVPWPKSAPVDDTVAQAIEPLNEAPLSQPTLATQSLAHLVSNSITSGFLPSTPVETASSSIPLTSSELPRTELLLPALAASAIEPPSWITWRNALALIWITGTSAWVGVFLVRLRRFRRVAALATPACDTHRRRVAELAARIGLRSTPELSLIDARVPPMTWGFGFRHEILVPTHLWHTLSAPQKDALILHELAHLKRGDHWVRQFELAVFVIHWWHPVTWWARQELQKAEEECCDAWVVRGLPNIAGDYAELIVDTIAYLAQPPAPALPPLASGLGHIRHVRKRLAAIFGGSAAPRLSLLAWAAIAATGVFLLPMIPTTSPVALAIGQIESGLSIDDGSLRGSNSATGIISSVATPDLTELDPLTENLTILQLQLIQREAELTEERLLLEQAVRTAQRGIALVARGTAALSVPEESLTDQKVREARVRGREAAVQELKLLIRREETRVNRERQRGRLSPGSPAQNSEGFGQRVSEVVKATPPVQQSPEEKRLDRIEHRLDVLFAEARALANDLKREQPGKE